MKKHVVKIQYNSPVVLGFAFLSLAVLILDIFTGGYTTVKLFPCIAPPPMTYLPIPGFSCTFWVTAAIPTISGI